MTKKLTVLDNGMTVVTEYIPHVETVSLGFWLNKGSRDETPRENGMFHFIEHNLFKGTPSRNARQIAEDMDGVGASLDAFTGKEQTCYSLKVREKHLDFSMDILIDMLRNPRFDEVELNRERLVILEEIKMEDDNPEELVFEHLMRSMWRDDPIGMPILGPPENVARFDHAETAAFHKKFYRNKNLVVSAAGKLDHDVLCRKISDAFPPETDTLVFPVQAPPKAHGFQVTLPNPGLEQVNFCINFNGYSYFDSKRHALNVLNTILGGGLSSRLFQRIREEEGLAYAVGSFYTPYSDCGHLTIFGGCSPENFQRVLYLCSEEVQNLMREGVSADELARAREQFIGNMVMGLESTSAISSVLARYAIYYNDIFDAKKAIAEIEAVTASDVLAAAQACFQEETMGLAATGKVTERDISFKIAS